MIDVFISYKREQRVPAERLARFLTEQGYTVWWDVELLSGDNFINEIFEVLKTAQCAVVLWSNEALTSQYVVGEAMYALNKNKYIGATVTWPIELPPPFNVVQMSNASAWQMGNAAFEELIPAIAKHAGAQSGNGQQHTDNLLAGAAEEALYWRGVVEGNRISDYELYLNRFGETGVFAELARVRIRALHARPSQEAALRSSISERPMPRMVEIPEGVFLMGSPHDDPEGDDDERPVRQVSIPAPFKMSIAPVSFDEFDGFCAETGRDLPSDNDWGRGKLPVINVSWDDANAYCAWLSSQTGKTFRLPSEAEWEYAARAGTNTARPWGREWNQACANGAVTVGRTNIPGHFPPNGFGLQDMIGNVWEWCADPSHDGYSGAPSDGSVWSENGDPDLRVIRGGAWDCLPQALRSAMRGWFHRGDGAIRIGFRVVQSS